jgi:hypothetical protein
MGILKKKGIADWLAAAELEAAIARGDVSTPVGTREKDPCKHTATRIALGTAGRESGRLVYREEVPLEVYQGKEYLLPERAQQALSLSYLRAWLFQARPNVPKGNEPVFEELQDADVLLTKDPPSQNYFVRVKLKRSVHRTAAQVAEDVEKKIVKATHAKAFADEKLDAALNSMSYTPFVTLKCRAAWAVLGRTLSQSVPNRKEPVQVDEESGKYEILLTNRHDSADNYSIAVLDRTYDASCGTAPPDRFAHAVDLLRVDPVVQEQLDRTSAGELFMNYLNAGPSGVQQQGQGQGPRGPVARPVTDKLCERRKEIMDAAIVASLAGRPDLLRRKRAGDALFTRCVGDYAAALYHNFAMNFVKRCGGEPMPVAGEAYNDQMAVRPRRRAGIPGGAASEGSIQSAIDRFRKERWRDVGRDKAAAGTLEAALGMAIPRKPSERWDAVIAILAWPRQWGRHQAIRAFLEKVLKEWNLPADLAQVVVARVRALGA